MGNNKAFKFVDLGITSAKLPFNTHLFWEHATYGLILVDADDQTKLFISTDKGDNWAEIDLSDNANSYKIQSGWLDGNDLWLIMCDNDGTADDFEVCFIELDDSNDCNPIGVSAGADANTVYAYDIWVYDGNTYALSVREFLGSNIGIIWDVDTHPFTNKDGLQIEDYTLQTFSFGVIVGDDIYFLVDDDAGQIIMVIYDHSGTSFSQKNSYDAAYSLPSRAQQSLAYDDSNLLYLILNKDGDSKNYLITYSITGDSFIEYSEYNIALMLDRNNVGTAPNEFEKVFDIAKDGSNNSRIWEIKPKKGGVIQLQTINYNGNIIAMTDNFMIVVNKVYEYIDILAINTIAEGKVNKGIFPILEKGRFNCHPDDAHFFSNDDTLKVYDEVDELILFAKITDKSQDENGIYQFGLDAYNNELWRRTYAKSHSANTTHEKQQDNIDNACGFCHRDSSIVATTTDYSYEQDRPPMSIFSLGRFMERQVGRASPNGLVTTEAYDGLTKALQYYPATYNFRDDAIATYANGEEAQAVAGIDFADSVTIGTNDGDVHIVASEVGHKKVLKITNSNASVIYVRNSFSAQPTGTIEFWAKGSYWRFYIGDSINNAVMLIIGRVATNILSIFYAGTSATVAYDGTEWMHVKIDFDTGTDTFSGTVNGVEIVTDEAFYLSQVSSGITHTQATLEVGNQEGIYDAIGYSWDVNYNVGDNVVAWDVEINGELDLINIRRDIPSYYVKKLGITRATCVGGVGISQTYADATLEDGKAILPLKEYRDLKIEQNVEALQLATVLFNVFSQETKFIGLRVVNQEYIPPGMTVNFANTGDVAITESDFLVLFYTYDFINDVYELMILTDNVVLLREFESYFDRSELMVHQNSTAVRDNSRFTKEGGIFVKLTNKTGVPSVKGSLVRSDTVVDNAFILTSGDDKECLGVVYENGIVDGDECKIVFSGRVRVLLKDATASTAQNWVATSDVPGRADATGANPAAAPTHFKEIGHGIETKGAGTDVLAFIMLHFL